MGVLPRLDSSRCRHHTDDSGILLEGAQLHYRRSTCGREEDLATATAAARKGTGGHHSVLGFSEGGRIGSTEERWQEMKYVLAFLMSIFVGIATAAGVTCDYPGKKGCWEIAAIGVMQNELTTGLESSAANAEEFNARTNEVGPRIYAAYQQKKMEVSNITSYVFYMYNMKGAKPKAYRIIGRKAEDGRVVKNDVVDVTGKVMYPRFADEKKLGTPKAYRVRADGAFGVSLQVPWSVVGDNSLVVIVAEQETVFPGKNRAHQFPPANVAFLKQQNATATLSAFVVPKKK